MDDLYFIASAEAVKIGRSADVRSRMKSLRTGSHLELTLLGIAEGQGWQERTWHRAFSRDMIRGEWFRRSPDLGRAIDRALAGEDWAEAVPPREASPLRLHVFGEHDPLRFRERVRHELRKTSARAPVRPSGPSPATI